jgi:hypothetical protein
MSPAALLGLSVLVTAMAGLIDLLLRRRRCRHLRKVARAWKMNFSPRDQFRLTARVAGSFPVPGAARIRVVNLIYGIESERYRYVFTAEYTAGIVTGKRRVRRAGTFSEPRDREASQPAIALAPGHLPLIEQYRRLTPPGVDVVPENQGKS